MLELRRVDAGLMSRLSARTALLMTLPPLLWAGNAVVGRLAVGSVPPLALNFLRWALAALLLLPLGWHALRDPSAIAKRWKYLLAIGLLGVGTYNSLQYLALVTTTPINVTLIAASTPVWMLMVGALFHGEHPTRRQIAGALLSLAGVLLVIARGDLQALARIHFVIGDLYVLVAVIAWAFYSWLLARPPATMQPPQRPDWDWAGLLLLQTLFGLLGAGAAAAAEAAITHAGVQWNGWVVAALLYVAIGPSVIAYRCWGVGVVQAGPAMAAFFANLTPVFAALLSAALLGEAPRWYHAVAFALIVGGIVVSSRK
ncbi:DMT family transporter [Piscinibacter sp. XHJ-5]|uniref:DMT family transporter n=1 Tax=Piscinibacter sp. XHJ-5 TaxID=3037797 RepID=UPI0024531D0B|nr:DMT family transporter [Piscinibacter sp. XHJ-5]